MDSYEADLFKNSKGDVLKGLSHETDLAFDDMYCKF